MAEYKQDLVYPWYLFIKGSSLVLDISPYSVSPLTEVTKNVDLVLFKLVTEDYKFIEVPGLANEVLILKVIL